MKGSSVRRGFSLIEVVVTLLIIGIVAAIAAPRLAAASSGSRIEAAEQRIQSVFQTAGEMARARGETITLQVDTDADAIFLFDGLTVDRDTLIGIARLGESPYEVDIQTTNITDPDGFIIIDGYGIFAEAPKIRIASQDLQRVVAISVPVAVVAGSVDDQGFDGSDPGLGVNLNIAGLNVGLNLKGNGKSSK
jgi:prepilin-type N-terminal cleavage/methylation domain-containing protein